jgi:hypothetical protein
MFKLRGLVIALGIVLFCAGHCAFFTSDADDFPKRQRRPFREKAGFQIWEDTARVPYAEIRIIRETAYVQAKNGRELEKQALADAKKLGADGYVVLEIWQTPVKYEIDVGRKRGDLNAGGFNLEDHGVEQDTLRFGNVVKVEQALFNMRARLFKYKSSPQ